MHNSEIQTIVALLQRTFNGSAWHGPNVLSVLEALSMEQLSQKRGNSHTIITLVAHMLAWRVFTLKKLQGDEDYDVTEALNFPVLPVTEENWNHLMQQLKYNQQQLLTLLEQQSDDLLQQVVPGKDYPYFLLLHGNIHHDLYHLGQIVLLSKAPS
ncbi:MAG: DinB family protein [Bacteroidota bacterium]